MSHKIECDECLIVFVISSKTLEPLQYCPYCGNSIILPEDAIELDDDEDDEVSEDDDF